MRTSLQYLLRCYVGSMGRWTGWHGTRSFSARLAQTEEDQRLCRMPMCSRWRTQRRRRVDLGLQGTQLGMLFVARNASSTARKIRERRNGTSVPLRFTTVKFSMLLVLVFCWPATCEANTPFSLVVLATCEPPAATVIPYYSFPYFLLRAQLLPNPSNTYPTRVKAT
jgi:hypothetical protein